MRRNWYKASADFEMSAHEECSVLGMRLAVGIEGFVVGDDISVVQVNELNVMRHRVGVWYNDHE